MFDCVSNASVAYKEKRSKLSYILYNFINCPVAIDITQTLYCKVAIE